MLFFGQIYAVDIALLVRNLGAAHALLWLDRVLRRLAPDKIKLSQAACTQLHLPFWLSFWSLSYVVRPAVYLGATIELTLGLLTFRFISLIL
jgi:hypothetical protein